MLPRKVFDVRTSNIVSNFGVICIDSYLASCNFQLAKNRVRDYRWRVIDKAQLYTSLKL